VANPQYQAGDKVQVTGNTFHRENTGNAGGPVLTVVRRLAHEADRFELSDGTIHASSELLLVEKAAADLPLESFADNEGRQHLRVPHGPAAGQK
jgi:hypothetical protein